MAETKPQYSALLLSLPQIKLSLFDKMQTSMIEKSTRLRKEFSNN
jgi:hypothetical protein